MKNSTADKFLKLLKIMKKIRNDCPWDKEQTHQSLRQYIVEEAYEVIETIDHGRWNDLSEELGDLLLQIVFQSAIAEEKNQFNIDTILDKINNKMINRHPHVFDEMKVDSSKEVKDNWEYIKIHQEKRQSLLSGIPKTAPALLRAQRIQEKASMVDFDWYKASDVLDKLQEELDELKEVVQKKKRKEIEEEIGDLLFTLVNVARFFKVTAEDALRTSNEKFVRRFTFIENHYDKDYDRIKRASLEELDQIWEKSKEQEIDRK
jgi:MazG family protein